MSMGLSARLRESLLLSRAAREAAETPGSTRDDLRRRLTVARQRAESADTLWANGHAAEALRLTHRALEEILTAAGALGAGAAPVGSRGVERAADEARGDGDGSDGERGADPDAPSAAALEKPADTVTEAAGPTPLAEGPVVPGSGPTPSADPLDEAAAVLASRGMDPEAQREMAEVVTKLRGPLPELDEDVTPTHADTFRRAMRLRHRAHRALTPAAMTPREVKLKRVGRWATLAAAAAIAVAAAILLLRTPHEAVATASGYFASAGEYAPDKAIDEDENTEWLLADGQTGWLEVRLSPPRNISKLRVRNGHNRHFRDRAVKEYEIELFDSDGQSAGSASGEFADFAPNGEWADVALAGRGVTRIRFKVKSFHRIGAALSELEWVE